MSQFTSPAAFTALATAAGIDLDQRGSQSRFAAILGCNPAQVSMVLRGTIGRTMMQRAEKLHRAIQDGTFTPASATARPATAAAAPVIENPEDKLSDEQLLEQINERFDGMMTLVKYAIAGKFTSVIITGPGGVGKTYPIENALRDADDGRRAIITVSGSISAVGLVEALWNTQNKGDVLLIDDADGGLENIDFVNVLKAATDSKERRVVSWLKQNKALAEAGVEPQFEYRGTVIIISNADLKATADGSTKKANHIGAVLSRAHHIDLGVNSRRALALRVSDMIRNKRMFDQKFAMAGMAEYADQAAEEIASFIMKHRDSFRTITLREADKIAGIYIACEGRTWEWDKLVRLTLGAL